MNSFVHEGIETVLTMESTETYIKFLSLVYSGHKNNSKLTIPQDNFPFYNSSHEEAPHSIVLSVCACVRVYLYI